MRVIAALAATLVIAACGGSQSDDTADTASTPPSASSTDAPAPTSAPEAAATAADAPTTDVIDLSGLPVAYQDADVSTGRRRFAQCRACHQVHDGTRHSIGPDLFGVFGRHAGGNDSYPTYSSAMKDSGIVWTAEELDAWIASPRSKIPGTAMVYVGMRDPNARRDLIAWLWVESGGAAQ